MCLYQESAWHRSAELCYHPRETLRPGLITHINSMTIMRTSLGFASDTQRGQSQEPKSRASSILRRTFLSESGNVCPDPFESPAPPEGDRARFCALLD